jgi:hypothetical protein
MLIHQIMAAAAAVQSLIKMGAILMAIIASSIGVGECSAQRLLSRIRHALGMLITSRMFLREEEEVWESIAASASL